MKRLTTMLLCLLLMLSAAAGEEVPQLLEPVGITMDTAIAYIGDLRETVMYDAYIAPEVTELYFKVDGRVGEIHTTIGQQVKQGDVLIDMDHESLMETTENLRQSIAMQEQINGYDEAIEAIDLEMLRVELARLYSRPEIDAQAVALKELDIEAQKLSMEQAQQKRAASLETMRENLARYEEKLTMGLLIAPHDGRIVAAASIERGSYAVAYNPLVYLADDTKLSIVSEFISSTELAGAAEIYALIGGDRYEIIHREMDAQEYASLMLSGATINITFDFATAPGEDVKTGDFVGVCLVRHLAQDALLIPSNALYSDDTGKYVYVVNNGDRVRSYVQTGLFTAWETEIVSGLKEGDVVYVQE